jgi:hypothetical protein
MIKKKYSELKEFTSAQMATLKKEYEPMRGKTISIPNVNKMNAMLDRMSKDMLTKLANADIPFISTGAASKLVMKHGMKFTDFKLNMSEADELQCEACWTGYKQVGMKKKGDRQVPNCVKEEDLKEMIGEVNDLRGSFSDAQLERMKQDWKNKSASAMTSSIKQTIMNMDAPTRAALKGAGINHISKFANSTLEEVEIEEGMVDEMKQPFVVVDTADGNKVVGTSSDERDAKSIVTSAELPPMRIKDKKTLKIMKSKNKQMIGQPFQEGMVQRVMQTIHDKLKKEGGAAGFDDIAKEVKKEFGITLQKSSLDNMPGVKKHRDGDYILEADLSKTQVKMVHKKADDLSKKDFVKRYGKDGDSVRFATATNMVKKKLGIEEEQYVPEQTQPKGEEVMNESYKDKFNATMKKFGINSLGDLKSDEEKKKFFKAVDNAHVAKNEELEEELSAAQKKLPAGLQKAIMKKQGKKDDKKVEESLLGVGLGALAGKSALGGLGGAALGGMIGHAATRKQKKEMMDEMMKEMMKEMSSKIEMLKAEKDPTKIEMMKKEMMTAMKKMPEMSEMSEMMKKEMMKEMMKKMDEYGDMNAMKDEGFSSDAQRKAAFASGYKEKGKKKDEMNEVLPAIARIATGAALAKQASGDAKTTVKNIKTMNAMKKESIDPSCPICEGEACQCAQSPSDTESVAEMAMNAMKMNAMKMPIRATYGKMNAMKTGDDDMTPMNNMKLNAMVKDPHKSKKDDPKKDMNAGYMKSDVRADVKNNGGADMAKVKDKPQMMPAMKKINAMYKTEKYLDEKEGSIQNTVAQMFETENRLVEVQDKNLEKMIADYLKKGGTITKLPPALAKGMKASGQSTFKVGDKGIIKSMYKMKEVREFVDTYNRHFLLNYKAEELINNEI